MLITTTKVASNMLVYGELKALFPYSHTTALQHCCNNRGDRNQVYLYKSCMLTTESIQQPQLYGNQAQGLPTLGTLLLATLWLLRSCKQHVERYSIVGKMLLVSQQQLA